MKPGEVAGGELSEPLRTYTRESGLVMKRQAKTAYTLPALEATEWAKEKGNALAFHKELYRAYWEFSKDIEQVEVLQDVARQCGLDPDALKAALADGRYRKAVLGQHQEAMELGIHAIPGFVVGRYMFMGAQPLEFFQHVAQRVLAEQQGERQPGE